MLPARARQRGAAHLRQTSLQAALLPASGSASNTVCRASACRLPQGGGAAGSIARCIGGSSVWRMARGRNEGDPLLLDSLHFLLRYACKGVWAARQAGLPCTRSPRGRKVVALNVKGDDHRDKASSCSLPWATRHSCRMATRHPQHAKQRLRPEHNSSLIADTSVDYVSKSKISIRATDRDEASWFRPFSNLTSSLSDPKLGVVYINLRRHGKESTSSRGRFADFTIVSAHLPNQPACKLFSMQNKFMEDNRHASIGLRCRGRRTAADAAVPKSQLHMLHMLCRAALWLLNNIARSGDDVHLLAIAPPPSYAMQPAPIASAGAVSSIPL